MTLEICVLRGFYCTKERSLQKMSRKLQLVFLDLFTTVTLLKSQRQ